MTRGIILLAVPLLAATLIWALSARIRGKRGKSLLTFIFGYVVVFVGVGFEDVARQWSRPDDFNAYITSIFFAVLAGYVIGGAGYLVLIWLQETPLGEYFPELLRWWLSSSSGSTSDEINTTNKVAAALREGRQRAIEECAEEACEYFVERGFSGIVDSDCVEETAADLRDSILALGERRAS